MSGSVHTYGPTCLHSPGDEDLSAYKSSPTPPRVRAQFFYSSSLPIDDPLSPLPPLSGSSSSQAKFPPQPFSARDNIALEKAWSRLRDARESRLAKGHKSREKTSRIPVRGREPGSTAETPKKGQSLDDESLQGTHGRSPRTPASLTDEQSRWSPRLRDHPAHEASSSTGASAQDSLERQPIRSRQGSGTNRGEEDMTSGSRKRENSPYSPTSKFAKRKSTSSPGREAAFEEAENRSPRGRPSVDMSTSGSPFIRAPLRPSESPSEPSSEFGSMRDTAQFLRPESSQEIQREAQATGLGQNSSRRSESRSESTKLAESPDRLLDKLEEDVPQEMVPVGASRLHLVELPNMKMKPIYWSPLHDISSVLRGTWFYKNTMLPVEPELANKLEEGYVYLKPWTETWQDELNSCVENGAEAEMKIVYRLWPKEDPKAVSRPGTAQDFLKSTVADESPEDSLDTLTFHENRAAGGTEHSESIKHFKNSSVIYVDAKDAQILRPSLLPSVSRGRRPLSAIRKGRQIGIPVVRGFNRQIWDKLHPSKQNPMDVRNYIRRPQTRNEPLAYGEQRCYACAIEESRPSPTDLVLVIHGIGQKLSERVESFHFTHAINAFRRQVNMELHSEAVWPHIRPDHGGIMVLPVNWRSTLSLEDADIDTQPNDDPTVNHFTLKDITPDSIPAIRNLISDVMLDIPYYLSHHKPKMIQAVVKEANRVYRLWCKNNPGFQENGRVHLIAHSLGSVMAMDILSHQPTKLPQFDFSTTPIHNDIFEFDTKNLFICGSPAGFFLLLNKANLLPRRGRDKPGREGEDRQRGVAGEADTYGCLAVDNIYNIMHTTDPIAYRLNAAVDSDLAESLKPAVIPSSSSSWLQTVSSVFRWSSSNPRSSGLSATTAGSAITSKLPSNVEMETHDFTREEIAEKRMFLLNDNGQIDYYLTGGGGPLNIQYLNMLSAHSSYWTLTDFIRFVVVEIARKQGKDGTLLALRAEKKKEWMKAQKT